MPVCTYLKLAYNYDFKDNTVLECGSCYNGDETSEFRLDNKCYYIEAEIDNYNKMITQPNVKSEQVFNLAISDKIGSIDFTITTWPGNSSINHSEEHIKELIERGARFNTVTVPCITYAHFIRNIIKKPIDILVLDVEGHELIILKTFKDLSIDELPKFLIIEAGYDWAERKPLLLELGYVIDFYQLNNVYLTHRSLKINKNIDVIHQINHENKEFVWCGNVIFKNDQLDK